MSMLKVYKQMTPEPIGSSFNRIDSNGNTQWLEWHAAKFKFLGLVHTWREAKMLTSAPVVEYVKD
jgi:hypothetical protein